MSRLIAICAPLLVAAVLVPAAVNRTIPRASAQGTWPATISLSPNVAAAGDEVIVRGTGPQTPDGASCVVTIASTAVTASCTVDAKGSIDASFQVPVDIHPGNSQIAVCWPACDDDAPPAVRRDYWQAKATLIAAAVVPDVRGATPTTAMSTLKAAGFTWQFAPDPPPEGSTIADQQPAAGSTATANSLASLTMASPAVVETLVTVPALVGKRRADAAKVLTALNLVPAGDGAETDTVTGQEPATLTQVPVNTTVTLQTAPPTPDPSQVQVPSLINQSLDEASATARAAGLLLQVTRSVEQGLVDTQDPAPGVPVNPGTTITVSLTAAGRQVETVITGTDTASSPSRSIPPEPQVSTSTGPPLTAQQSGPIPTSGTTDWAPFNQSAFNSALLWPAICGLVLVLGLAGALAFRGNNRRRHAEHRALQHITVRAAPGPISVTTAPTGDAHQDHTYQLITHERPGSTTVQEHTS